MDNFYDAVLKIDNLTDNYSDKNLDEIELYFGQKGIMDYFIRRIAGLIDNDFDPNPWLNPLYVRKYFNPQNNPERYKSNSTYLTPIWNVLPFLRSISKKNKDKENEYMEILIKIVDSLIEYKDEQGNRINNSVTDEAILEIISNFPEKCIKKHHVEFIRSILRSKENNTFVSADIKEEILPNFIDKGNKSLILELLDIILDYRDVDQIRGYSSLMERYWLHDTLKNYKSQIFDICKIKGINVAINKIKDIIANYDSGVSVPVVENHPQNMIKDDYEYLLVSFIRDFFEISDPDEIRNTLIGLFNEDHSIFKRIALHTVNYHYNDLNDLFWNWSENINPLNSFSTKHEMYELLKDNCLSFNEAEINKIVEWIETNDYYVSDRDKSNSKEKERTIAYQKLEWLSAFKNLDNEKINELVTKYKKISPTEHEHPGMDYWVGETIWVEPKKPEKTCKKSNQDIAQDLIEKYKKDKKISWVDEDSYDDFSACVFDNPTKFSNDLDPFLEIPKKYQHELLSGLLKALTSKKDFEWEEIIKFILKIIKNDLFWIKDDISQFNYEEWIISTIADIINEKTRNDDNPFNKDLLPNICEILFILAENTDSELNDMGDIVTSVLNSPLGKIFTSMINFSLSYARLYKDKGNENRWIELIKLYLEKRLENPSIELSVVMGEHLPFIFYLDKKWAEENINLIFANENWGYAFEGYLRYPTNIYENIYSLLKQLNHYNRAIKTPFKDTNAVERLVYHICTAYVYDIETLEDPDSLISELIYNGNIKQLIEIIRFFLIQKDKNFEKIRPKIKPLWNVMFKLTSRDPTKYEEVISDLAEWVTFFDEIDEELFRYLMFSVKYYKNTLFIIDDLAKYVEKYPEEIGEIYIELIKHSDNIYYKNETIKDIINTLYEKNEKENADFICNVYGENGFYFLRELYDRYR